LQDFRQHLAASSQATKACHRNAHGRGVRHRVCCAVNEPSTAASVPDSRSECGHDPQAQVGRLLPVFVPRRPQTGKRRNLSTFETREAAERHKRAVQHFEHQGGF
jgi:hypothetical protein